jgi:hypothetical protein
MTDSDKSIEAYYALKPNLFPTLVRLEMRQEQNFMDDTPILVLNIELRPKSFQDSQRLLLMFFDVSGLKLTPPDMSLLQFMDIEISSIREQQWEKIRYTVREIEDDAIEFRCAKFSASIVNAGI